MLILLDPDVRHEANQGEVRIGAEKFTEFLQSMDESYEEILTVMVLLSEPTGKRVAAEFIVNGIYKKAEKGMPEAYGQSYVLPAGAFLEIKEGRISRVTTYYNLPLWIDLVSKAK
ncbi:steroid delta-isomerase-like uncharacterized protein [Dyadobacter arcticus]|uniref:Steroid delta-isomerase-like uncharacterized protein n=2 Tax=Dyadobacter arcticus TaxID=1078754 RepID=A0ABX0UUJ2_9BACT|nr:steroid delta-isomerase-like uncharacterized protein [Dyadobacter arcticus]